MTTSEKQKAVNLEDLQEAVRDAKNMGLGNECTCSTAADTAAKTVTLGTTFALVNKATIVVTFTYGISVANATLAVTHTTLAGTTTTEAAKPIYLNGAALEAGTIDAGATLILRYDGTNFNIIGGAGEGGPDAAYWSATGQTAGAPGFDPMLDTVHNTAQTLTAAQKAQARTNIDVYSKAEIAAMRAPAYNPTTKLISFPATAAFDYDSTTKIITLSV